MEGEKGDTPVPRAPRGLQGVGKAEPLLANYEMTAHAGAVFKTDCTVLI